jgi:N-hydroxyarylamine O-acetyltransferase
MLSDNDIDRYLQRIGVDRADVTIDLDGLSMLQHAHLTTVPFTNLDVYDRLPVRTGLDWSIPAVINGRGGWCFVLNGAFDALLTSLGFEVTRLGAIVLMAAETSPMDDHLCLKVTLKDTTEWLVDVGFGESFTRPMRLNSDEPIDDIAAGRRYRLNSYGDGLRQLESEQSAPNGTADWRVDYRFSGEPRDLGYFDAANEYLRSTVGLMWTAKRFSTRLTEFGRVTLLHDRIRHSPVGGEFLDTDLANDDAWEAARRRHLPSQS